MKYKNLQKLSVFLLAAATLLSLPSASAHGLAPTSTVSTVAADTQESLSLTPTVPDSQASVAPAINVSAAVPCSPAAATERKLIPGGMPFGVKFTTAGVLVVGFCDVDTTAGKVNPAYAAGLRTGDIIQKLNDTPIGDAATLSHAMEVGGGSPFTVTFTREGSEHTVTLTPAYSASEGKYKSGIWIRDSGAGIGTVTFIDPESGIFAGLGHGICDGDTGQLIPLNRGTVIDVTISGIVRGIPGTPGEVKGYFNSEKLGSVFGNTDCGVFGLFAKIPAGCGESIPVASRSDVHEGKAELLCSLDSGIVQRYAVAISAINPTATSNKCFTVTVTDQALIEKTGGIVQGMSGSPLIQDGKLIGAVTHVLVGDPTTGYGIFIENMLNQMNTVIQ